MIDFKNCLNLVFSNELLSIVLLSLLLYATYTDIKYLKIYNKFNLFIVGIRLLFIFIPNYSYSITLENIIASITAFILFLSIGVIFMHKMGGDIKFITAFMLFFNIEYMMVFNMIASVLNLIYSSLVKLFLKRKRKKIINTDSNSYKKDNLILYYIVKIFIVKMPKDDEIARMTNEDFNKYKLPFAPFFLMSYLITYILYLVLN